MSDYFKERNIQNITRLRKVQKELPPFCAPFFTGIENRTSVLTRLNYAYDLRIFFDYLLTETNDFPYSRQSELTLVDLEKLKTRHIEQFLSYLSYYTYNGKTYTNNERAKSRKISAIRTMLKYFFKSEQITSNIGEKIELPKLHDKEIVRLEVNEVANLLNIVESGENLTTGQKRFHEATKLRDLAMLTLFLGTGIRISECVGLNIEDIDLSNNSFIITRKGGNRTTLYLSDEVSSTLKAYIADRKINPKYAQVTDTALFLSLQNKRINVKTVQLLVEKYSQLITSKRITPHKLRSTFGTNLYRETKDIYIVADVLGHKDVNTTKKHYAAISDDLRRAASKSVILREPR